MIAARREIDLRPQLERLDRFLLPAAGVDGAGLNVTFRPLWQLDAKEKAAVALQKAQATVHVIRGRRLLRLSRIASHRPTAVSTTFADAGVVRTRRFDVAFRAHRALPTRESSLRRWTRAGHRADAPGR